MLHTLHSRGLCSSWYDPCRLSRKDALKRHIQSLHAVFAVLIDSHEEFDILRPRRKDQFEDLTRLIEFCVFLQLQAEDRGVEIKEDLAALHPQVATAIRNSWHT